jgi:hypothetical protein
MSRPLAIKIGPGAAQHGARYFRPEQVVLGQVELVAVDAGGGQEHLFFTAAVAGAAGVNGGHEHIGGTF